MKEEVKLEAVVAGLEKIVGASFVKTDDDSKAKYGRDWTKAYEPSPSLIVLPADEKQVSDTLRFCHDHHLAVVPSGGRTGLAAGAVATNGEVVISLERMNRIESIDPVGLTIVVQAGVTTQAIQEAAKQEGLYFGLDLAAKGSCQIGGNIATNAGGLKLIRYGGTREQVLGLEVVLANGEILDLNKSLRKNNVGYDLKHLFIGSEGSLGIVTKATLRLLPKPQEFSLCCLALDDFSRIPDLLKLCNKSGLQLSAFEFFDLAALRTVLKYMPNCSSPFAEESPVYVLLETEAPLAEGGILSTLVERAFEKEIVADGVIAESSAQFHALWALRENISEAVTNVGFVHKNDISVPISGLADFISELKTLLLAAPKELELLVFGHIGDGNLHINYLAPLSVGKENFRNLARGFEVQMFEVLQKMGGSISAEHGIGLLKKKDLHYSCSPEQIDFMRQIKKVFDPKGIMNPGKIFD